MIATARTARSTQLQSQRHTTSSLVFVACERVIDEQRVSVPVQSPSNSNQWERQLNTPRAAHSTAQPYKPNRRHRTWDGSATACRATSRAHCRYGTTEAEPTGRAVPLRLCTTRAPFGPATRRTLKDCIIWNVSKAAAVLLCALKAVRKRYDPWIRICAFEQC